MKRPTESWPVGRGTLEIVDASIVDISGADVYVSSDDNYLSHGGGVSAAIWRTAGADLAKDAAAHPVLSLGDTFRTTGGALGEWVWHAITLDLDRNRRLSPTDGQLLYARVLEEVLDHLEDAARRGYRRRDLVVTPLLGAGAGGLGAEASMTALLNALQARVDLSRFDVRLVVCAQGDGFEFAVAAARGHAEALQLATARSVASLSAAMRAFEAGLRVLAQRACGPDEGERLDRLTLGRLLSRVVNAREASGDPLARAKVHALERAVEARNRYVHFSSQQASPGEGPLLADLRGGVEALRLELGHRDQVPHLLGAIEPTAHPSAVHAPEGARPDAVPRSRRSPTDSSGPEIDPVRILRDFLLDNLPEAACADYLSQLRARGFVGEDALCLLEACVVEEDPVGLLCDLFPAREVRGHLQRHYGVTRSPRERGPDLARELLRAMGFPVAGTGRGVVAARDLVARARAELPAASYLEIRGAVSRVAAELEYVALVLLRFLAEVVFGQPADRLAVERGWLERTYSLDRCSLGKLLAMLEHLGRALEEGEEAGVREFRRNFGTNRLAPEGAAGIAALRNRFAHYDRQLVAVDLHAERRLARDFYDQVDAFLAHLVKDGQRVFPHLVVVERIVVDRWGRRVYYASGERDHPERIYTDRRLTPGEVYFMHPLTNPLRVDPILVAAGDLGRPSQERTSPNGGAGE